VSRKTEGGEEQVQNTKELQGGGDASGEGYFRDAESAEPVFRGHFTAGGRLKRWDDGEKSQSLPPRQLFEWIEKKTAVKHGVKGE